MLFLDYFGGILCYIETAAEWQEIQVRKSWDDMQQMATSWNRTLCRCGKDWAFAHGVHTNRVHTLIFIYIALCSFSKEESECDRFDSVLIHYSDSDPQPSLAYRI